MPVLVDLECLCEAHTDATLDYVLKAQSEDPPGDSIWDPHPNPYIRRIVEMFTRRGLDRLAGVDAELRKWLGGSMHKEAHQRPQRPAGAMERWSQTEVGLVRLYLESLPPEQFALDDWMMLVDYLTQRYLPAADLRTEAEWLATRSSLMGRVNAAMRKDPTEQEADSLLAALPATVAAAEQEFGFTAAQRATLEYGAAHCAENVVALTDSVRHRLRRTMMDYSEAKFLGDAAKAAENMQSRLLDEFGQANRDWRRIAVTEATEIAGQGLVASVPSGTRVRRVEKYRGACGYCRSIDGKVFVVVAPDAADKDGEKQVWAGKTNVGRSGSPKRRAGGSLVDRDPGQMWWPVPGATHPNCRGSMIVIAEPTRAADPKFSAWMDNVLARAPA